MADHTKIEWTDATWNPITGCTLVSEGCRNCYAAQLAATRLKDHPSRKGLARINAEGVAKFTGEVRFNEQWIDQPLRWRKPRMIFVCAHGDLFHESVPDEWIDQVFAVMALCPHHIFQVLTKRPERMRAYLTQSGADTAIKRFARGELKDIALGNRFPKGRLDHAFCQRGLPDYHWPLLNVWLGTSVEDQVTADVRIPYLLATPASVYWISAEPLLGRLDLTNFCNGHYFFNALTGHRWHDAPEGQHGASDRAGKRLGWVVCGGESGAHARPMHPAWARSLRDQCAAASVPFLFKQWGEWVPQVGAVDGWAIDDDPEISRFDHREWDEEKGDWSEPFRPMWCDWTDGNIDEEQCVSRIGKRRAGRQLDGVEHNGFPGAA